MNTLAQLVEDNQKYELVFENDSMELFVPIAVRSDEYDLEGYIDEKGDYCIEVEMNHMVMIEGVEYENIRNIPEEFKPEYHSHLSDQWLINLMQGYSTSNHSHASDQWLINMFDGYATQSYVNTKFEQVVNNAPLFLDTLDELAAALGDDPNFATTVLAALDTKALKTNLLTPVPENALFTDTQLTNQEVVDAVNTILGHEDWQSAGGTMTGAEIESALDAYFGNTVWKTDTDTNTQLSNAEVVTAIDTYLGQSTWQTQYSHPSSHSADIIDESATRVWFTPTLLTKLTNIEAEANNYIHPTNHTPDIITQDASNRFVTDAQITAWDAKATIAYVDAAVASLLDSAPEALNTLDELASALGDDPNFATTISTQIGLKANSADIYTQTEVDTALGLKEDLITKAAGYAKWTGSAWSFVDETYEAAFSKNDAFNCSFGSTVGTVCQGNDSRLSDARTPLTHGHTGESWLTTILSGYSVSDHDHDETYEPVISTKNTGFNLALGTVAGTVSEGDHTHSDLHNHSNKNVLDVIISSGDGDLFLANDGTYKAVSGGSSTPSAMPIMRLSSTSTQDVAQGAETIITWDGEVVKDTGFTHNISTNNTRGVVDADGTYMIGGNIRIYEDTDQRIQFVTRILVNGIDIGMKFGSSYIRNSGNSSDYWTCNVGPTPLKLNADDYVELSVEIESQTTVSVTSVVVGSESDFFIVKLQGETGASGADGSIDNNWKGDYSGATAYAVNNLVRYTDGNIYIAIAPTTGNIPTNGSYWDLFLEKGETGSVSNHNHNRTIKSVTSTAYTFVLTDNVAYVRGSNSSAQTYTVPPNTSVAYSVGDEIHVRQAGAGQITFAAGSGVTINTSETLKLRTQHSTATLIKVGTDEWDLIGDLEAA